MQKMYYFSCYCNKYNEIKMCDLEPFSKIRSHICIYYELLVVQNRHSNGTLTIEGWNFQRFARILNICLCTTTHYRKLH